MVHVHSDTCESCIPLDELDLAEELADCIGDPAFPALSTPDMNDYVDTLAGLYATADQAVSRMLEDDNEED